MGAERLGFSALHIPRTDDRGPLVVALDEVACLQQRTVRPWDWNLTMNGGGVTLSLSEEHGKLLHRALLKYLEEEE